MTAASFDPHRWLQEQTGVAGERAPPPNAPNPANPLSAVDLGELGGLGGVCAQAATSHTDYPDIHAEPELPAPGTPPRDALDIKQADLCAGLLRAALPSREPRRLQGWASPADRAVPGDRCSACLGRQWWLSAQGAGGCLACQQPRPAGTSQFTT